MKSLNGVAMLLMIGALAASGCKSKPPPEKPQEQAQQPLFKEVDQRMSASQQRGEELSQIARQLPGRNPEEDRKLVAGAFDRAHAALELLAGPNPSGTLRQSLRIIDNTRQALSSSSSKMSMDPTVDSGLRAIYAGLASIREQSFPNDQQVQSLLDGLRSRIDELDTVRGPMHSLVVADGFAAASDVIRRMAGELDQRAA